MDRRNFLLTTAASLVAAQANASRATSPVETNPVPESELSIQDIAASFAAGNLSSLELTQSYLDRIDRLNRRGPELRAVLEINPQALETAALLDKERHAKRMRGPLHGVPVLLKDNIESADRMMTTAGSLALEGWYAPQDAPLVARLRAAGAVILGKTNLSEWANFRSTHSISGWSGRGGQTRNPYVLDRTPSGSSSGSAVAVAANLCAVAVGTETDGSIVSPASVCGIVGIKPTLGLVSRRGVVPLSHSQDTAGPMSRSVRDAAVMLGILSGLDSGDPASIDVGARFQPDYLRFLSDDGLRGARLGIARKYVPDNAPLQRYFDAIVAQLKQAGAVLVDPADLPDLTATGSAELDVLLYDFKHDIDAYLARLPPHIASRTLADLIRFNDAHADREMIFFDQELFRQAQAKGGLDEAAYAEARAACLRATRTQGIDAVIGEHRLDAIVTLTQGPAGLIDTVGGDSDGGGCSSPAAIAGYPHITVPSGLYRNLPVGLSFFGSAFSEPTLLRLASGFEHVAKARVAPRFLIPSLA